MCDGGKDVSSFAGAPESRSQLGQRQAPAGIFNGLQFEASPSARRDDGRSPPMGEERHAAHNPQVARVSGGLDAAGQPRLCHVRVVGTPAPVAKAAFRHPALVAARGRGNSVGRTTASGDQERQQVLRCWRSKWRHALRSSGGSPRRAASRPAALFPGEVHGEQTGPRVYRLSAPEPPATVGSGRSLAARGAPRSTHSRDDRAPTPPARPPAAACPASSSRRCSEGARPLGKEHDRAACCRHLCKRPVQRRRTP